MFEGYNGPILPQDFRVIYQRLASTPQGIGALIEFLTTKLDRIINEVINGEQVATSIYALLASKVARDDEILKVYTLKSIRTEDGSMAVSYTLNAAEVELPKVTIPSTIPPPLYHNDRR